MSSRPGGEADKFGNRYEGVWTVRYLLAVLAGEGQSITIEDVGDLAKGSEFTYRTDDAVQVYQVKRQNGNHASWTVNNLQKKDIWQNARNHVEDGRQFHFVSMTPAPAIQKLADEAKRANNLEEFQEHWETNATRDALNDLAALSVFGTKETAWAFLQGFYIRCSDDAELTHTNAVLAGMLLDGASGSLAAVGLGDLAEDALGKTLDASGIEARLPRHKLKRSPQLHKPTMTSLTGEVTRGWAASVERELLTPIVSRPDTNHLVELVDDPSGDLILVTGDAGNGKSATLFHLLKELERRDVPTLAFRLDRRDPFTSPRQLGEQLDLGISPVAALANIAGDRPCVLILDQLDAISMTSGRMPESFDAVADLLLEASVFENMRVVLACRKFDVENDDRIRRLVADDRCTRFDLEKLSEEQVTDAVTAMGLNAGLLSPHQKKLLQSPLHLVLLKVAAGDATVMSFQTTQNLFDAYWRTKAIACNNRPKPARFNDVIRTVAEAISSRQRLSVPKVIFDRRDLIRDAEVLISESILVEDSREVAFFHEAFFDYAFARVWLESNESLVEFLTAGEQELFRRSQVRQILNHLREADPERFALEVEAALISEEVRFHVKDVVLAIIATLPAPTSGDWEAVKNVLQTHPPFEERLWRSLCTAPWFERLDAEGDIEDWLDAGDESEQGRALEIMGGAGRVHATRLAEILEPHASDSTFPSWLRWIARYSDVHKSRLLFDMLLNAVRDGHYDDMDHDLWFSAHDLAEHQPAWAAELLAVWLSERPDAMEQDEQQKIVALLSRDHSQIEMTKKAAAGAAQRFCELLLPYMLRVMEATALPARRHPIIADRHFHFRYPQSNMREMEEALLFGMSSAIRTAAEEDPERVRSSLETLAGSRYEAAQWLLYEGLRSAPQEFAEWTSAILLQGTHRFMSGYTSNNVWSARQLIAASSQFYTDEAFAELESQILTLRFPWEEDAPEWYVFNLLSAMEEERLSDDGKRRLAELRHTFKADEPAAPTGVTGGFIGSPVPIEEARQMNDAQWLQSMAEYNQERTDWNTFTGGAPEFSQVLKAQVTQEPDRFAHLALRLTSEVHPAYPQAILMGLGEAEAPPGVDSVFAAIRHIAALGPENDRWLGWALRPYYNSAPLDIVQLILDRARNSSDPSDGSLSVRVDRENAEAENIYTSGMNTARGAAAETLGNLLISDPDGSRTALVVPVLSELATDPAITVRSMVAHVIHVCASRARSDALEAFQLLIEADDNLLATHPVMRLIAYLGYDNPETVKPVIERMLSSTSFEVRKAGGDLAALAAGQWGVADLIEGVLTSDNVAQREGAARGVAALLSKAANKEVTRKAFEEFVNDSDETVRKAVAEAAPYLRGEKLRPLRRPLLTLISSAAFTEAVPQLFLTLEAAPDRIDDLLLACAQRFIEVHGAEAKDMRTGAAADAMHVSDMLVRSYSQAVSTTARSKVLDLLDQLIAVEAYGVVRSIEKFERK
ncbi:hypothetical protein ACWD0Z_10195 [Streptomyces sp. NPDC003007]